MYKSAPKQTFQIVFRIESFNYLKHHEKAAKVSLSKTTEREISLSDHFLS